MLIYLQAYRILAALLCLAVYAQTTAAHAQTPGCTDARALNYAPQATRNDGSCAYPDTLLMPSRRVALDPKLVETSGLAFVGDALYTHNDSDDPNVYRIDTLSARITESLPLASPAPRDWEALAIVEGVVYVGDFGNNASGNRRNLHILRLALEDLEAGRRRADTLHFTYADQRGFGPQPPNTTDFDCEAFFVTADTVYLLTKEWTRLGTALYTFPNRPGRHVAQPRGRLQVDGLVTDASYRPDDRTLVLAGYSNTLQPFAYLLSDFAAGDFFGGNRRKVQIDLPFHQVEGIASRDGRYYYVSNERFSRSIVTVPQELNVFDLGGFLAPGPVVSVREAGPAAAGVAGPAFYPNPAQEVVHIDPTFLPAVVMLRNTAGRIVLARRVERDAPTLAIGLTPAGAYSVAIGGVERGTLVKTQ